MESKKWKSEKQILNELKEENSQLKKQTTSQQQTIERLREGFANEKQQQEIIESSYKLFKRILELEKLWMPTWTKDPPIEHLDEAIALKSMSKICKMLIEKIESNKLLNTTEPIDQ